MKQNLFYLLVGISLSYPLAGFSNTQLCIKNYDSKPLFNNVEDRVNSAFKQVYTFLSLKQDHPSIIASFILQKTDRVFNEVSRLNEGHTLPDMSTTSSAAGVLSKTNISIKTELAGIESLATKRFTFKTKGMKATSLNAKIQNLEKLKSTAESYRSKVNEEIILLSEMKNEIISQQGRLTVENTFINQLIEKLSDEGEYTVSALLMRKSVNLSTLETILQHKIDALDSQIKTYDLLLDEGQILSNFGLSTLFDTIPSLQPLMTLIKQKEDAQKEKLANIERDRLQKERDQEAQREQLARNQEAYREQLARDKEYRLVNLQNAISETIALSRATPYGDNRNSILLSFANKNSDILGARDAIILASQATYGDTRKSILWKVYSMHSHEYSVETVIEIAKTFPYGGDLNSVLLKFAKSNLQRLTVNDLLRLSNVATYSDTRAAILNLGKR